MITQEALEVVMAWAYQVSNIEVRGRVAKEIASALSMGEDVNAASVRLIIKDIWGE